MKIVGNDVYLADNNSTFGTLIQIRNPINLVENKAYSVQVERAVLTFMVKKAKLTYEDEIDEKYMRIQKDSLID